ncbi:MAG: hypothetical protein ACR2IE_17360 [Candidatus Sumerlaeaceae bacterium]
MGPANIYEVLESATDVETAEQHLQQLKSIRRTFAQTLKADENARERFLADLASVLEELEDWPGVYRASRERLKIVRPAARSNHALVFLIAQYLESARRTVKPKPYVCELLDQVRFVEDVAVEPVAVVALRQMVLLSDFKLCGKAIYIFKKVARRYGMPDLAFTRASVDQLFNAYREKYLQYRWQ